MSTNWACQENLRITRCNLLWFGLISYLSRVFFSRAYILRPPTLRVFFFSSVPSAPPPVVLAHATSYTSVMMSWKAIPTEHENGLLRGYMVQIDGMDDDLIYGCTLNMNIMQLEKSKVYKLRVAGFNSKGHGNFSDFVIVNTNINGMELLHLD